MGEGYFVGTADIDVLPRGGVDRVARLLGIAPERVYCVGDNQNEVFGPYSPSRISTISPITPSLQWVTWS